MHSTATAPQTLALEVNGNRLRAAIASMALALDGLDAVVFTGGVGERASLLRSQTTAGLSLLGLVIDPERNAKTDHDEDIGVAGAAVRILVVGAREDLEIVREVRALLSSTPAPLGS